jgi:hypothetical protein
MSKIFLGTCVLSACLCALCIFTKVQRNEGKERVPCTEHMCYLFSSLAMVLELTVVISFT